VSVTTFVLFREDRQKLLEGKHEILERRLEMMGEQVTMLSNYFSSKLQPSHIFVGKPKS
jgi:hypothetical protein